MSTPLRWQEVTPTHYRLINENNDEIVNYVSSMDEGATWSIHKSGRHFLTLKSAKEYAELEDALTRMFP